MKITVLDAATLGSDTDFSPLEKMGELTLYPFTAPEQVTERGRDSEALLVNKLKLNESNLSGCRNLKLICVFATGYDNIDIAYCRSRGIAVCNVPGYSTDSVAQLTVAMVLSLYNHLGEYQDFVRSGRYSAGTAANCLVPVWHELAGKTWGIVGAGNIGRQVAAVAAALGCRVLVYRRSQDPDYETVDLDTLLTQSDVVSVHLPLTDATRNLISREKISIMKPGAVFINVARGAVTDETALAEALKEGKLGGLGIDVYSAEPMAKDHPFAGIKDNPNVILTPHTAWGSIEARNRCAAMVAENIAAFAKNEEHNRIC